IFVEEVDAPVEHDQRGAIALDIERKVGAGGGRRRRLDLEANAARLGAAPDGARFQRKDAVGGLADTLDDERRVAPEPQLRAVGNRIASWPIALVRSVSPGSRSCLTSTLRHEPTSMKRASSPALRETTEPAAWPERGMTSAMAGAAACSKSRQQVGATTPRMYKTE